MKKLLSLVLALAACVAHADTAHNVRIGSPSSYIQWGISATQAATLSSTTLTNANDGVAQCLTAPAAATITHVGYHQGATAGAGAAYTATIETTTTNGVPSGTTVGGVTATTFNPTGSGGANDNTWQWVSLGANTYTLTQGQEVCIVIRRTAASDSTTMVVNAAFNVGHHGYPVALGAAAGTWSRINVASIPALAMKSSSAVYGMPWTGSSFAAQYTNGGLVESGMAFTLPTSFCSTFKLRGISILAVDPSTSASDTYIATLYSSPTSSPARIDQSVALTADRFANSAGTTRQHELYFTSSTTLSCGTTYGVAVATTQSSQGKIYYLDVASASDFDGWDFRQQASFITRTLSGTGNNTYAGIVAGTAAGNFTATATRRPWFELILEDITAPSGGGGSGSMGGVF